MLASVLDQLKELLLPLSLIATVLLGLWVCHWLLLRRSGVDASNHMARQLSFLLLVAVAIVLIILALPVPHETRNQLLSLLGLVLTGVIAFSSTTFVANIMAGLMLRAVRSFRTGDFIRVADHFGRVTERGLFHIEIQSEERDLITLPNLYVASNPAKVVHSSGTIVTCDLSLGYDVPHYKIVPLLKQAATQAGLQEPFVHVRELGDFAISYRICGFYEEVKQLLSKRSELRIQVLDNLHGAGIEIVSPTFMNQRQVNGDNFIAPPQRAKNTDLSNANAETMMFDKAERAEKLEALEKELAELREAVKQQDTQSDTPAENSDTQARQNRIALLERIIEVAKENGKQHD
ncbi:MAG: mechanosensitive ion channel family protein [Porticoccaceae bacterium]|nr:mechanosensitive ion channel family protein [Porticoccaceae bacterium]